MATGTHWEWRAFGAASSDLAARFIVDLGIIFPPMDFVDVYLWTPGLKVNVKVRDFAAQPFKFKHLLDKDGVLEKWDEKEEEIFRVPLDKAGWAALAETLTTVNVTLGPYPSGDADAATIIARVQEAGASTVTVNKRRESRLWRGTHGLVAVEWACISSPEAIVSIGLETWDVSPEGPGLPGGQAKEDILAAIEALGLDNEPLRVMNYVDAVAAWASGEKI